MVDLRGIEPLPYPCHGYVIPFYYRPVFGILAVFCKNKKAGCNAYSRPENGRAISRGPMPDLQCRDETALPGIGLP